MNRTLVAACTIATLVAAAPLLRSQPTGNLRIDIGLGLGHFQQQVKQNVGDERGERIVNEFDIGAWVSGTWRLHEQVAAGLFVRTDRGERRLARFAGFDGSGRTIVRESVGGTYTELWVGPLIQMTWWRLSAELGYGVLGLRDDTARDDLPSASGSTDDAFTTHPTIAWLAALGIAAPLTPHLDLTVRVEYRVRYYDERGGEQLAGGVDHGTQSIAPIAGIAWRP